jgi:hypothetical protein
MAGFAGIADYDARTTLLATRRGSCLLRRPTRYQCESDRRATELILGWHKRPNGPRISLPRCPLRRALGRAPTRSCRRRDARFRHARPCRPPIPRLHRRPVGEPDSFPPPAPPSLQRRRANAARRSWPARRWLSHGATDPAVKLAFADAQAYVADIEHMAVRPERLLDKEYLWQVLTRATDPGTIH